MDNLVERTVHNDNDSSEDEYTVTIQFIDANFHRLIEAYNNSTDQPSLMGALEGSLGEEPHGYKRPYEWGDSTSELDFVIWLARQVETKILK